MCMQLQHSLQSGTGWTFPAISRKNQKRLMYANMQSVNHLVEMSRSRPVCVADMRVQVVRGGKEAG